MLCRNSSRLTFPYLNIITYLYDISGETVINIFSFDFFSHNLLLLLENENKGDTTQKKKKICLINVAYFKRIYTCTYMFRINENYTWIAYGSKNKLL